MSVVLEFLKPYKARKGESFTHTLAIEPRGSYYIKDPKLLEKFFEVYGANYKKEQLGLTERVEGATPLRADFDFLFDSSCGKKRLYTQTDITNIIKMYQNIIMDMVEPTEVEGCVASCALLEKSVPRVENGYIKDGFHLHFPHFIVPAMIQDVIIRNKVLTELETSKVFADFRDRVLSKIVIKNKSALTKLSIADQIQHVVDPIGTKVWLMYGSRKAIGAEPFLVTKCFDDGCEEIGLEELFDVESAPKKVLPMLFSIIGRVATPLNNNIMNVINEREKNHKQKKIANKIRCNRPIEESLAELKTIEDGKIMEMLDPKRADDRDMWVDVGWTLFNIGQGHEKALDMWIEFSKLSSKFKDGECEKMWEKMELRGKTIASLLSYAKNDSPEEYNQWKKDQLETLLYAAVATTKPTNKAVALVMAKLYKDRFVCVDTKKETWYEFYNHKWHLTASGISVTKKLIDDVADIFWNFANRLRKKMSNDDDDKKESAHTTQYKRALKYVEELGQTGFCKSTLKMCIPYMYDDKFLLKMNEQRELIGFENGVYDLSRGIFRDGSPDDYITFSTGLMYKKFSYDDPEVQELQEYLSKVFVNENIRNYYLDFMCSCLMGGNKNKIFAVFTGQSDAGKSVAVKMIKAAFGDYWFDFPEETFLLGKRGNAGAARPDLARVRGKRLGILSEVARNQKLDISAVKKLTGNDSFWARNGYEFDAKEIVPMFTSIMMCNEPPKIPASDEATWNRIRVIMFESLFPKPTRADVKVPETLKEQYKQKVFPQDPYFDDKIDGYVDALMWLLLERFKLYLKNGLVEPNEVKYYTNQYQLSNDIYKQFINDKIVKVEDETKIMNIKEAYQKFRVWLAINYPALPKEEKIGQTLFAQEIEQRLKPKKPKPKKGASPSSTKWLGLVFREEEKEDDNNSDDEIKLD